MKEPHENTELPSDETTWKQEVSVSKDFYKVVA